MAGLRIYRDFYRINHNISSQLYTLINVSTLSATVVNASTSFLIETPSVINTSTGVYYVELNPTLYSPSDIYEILWNVIYVSGIGNKILKTRFKLDVDSVGGITNVIYAFDQEIDTSPIVDFEMAITDDLEIMTEENKIFETNIEQEIDIELLDNDISIEIND